MTEPVRNTKRGILREMLVLDCVNVDGKEALIVLPKGMEVEVSIWAGGYSESGPEDVKELLAYLNREDYCYGEDEREGPGASPESTN